MEARLRTLASLRIVQGQESRPSLTEPLDAGERRDVCNFDNRRDLAAGEIWGCVEREQQTHLEAILLAAARLRSIPKAEVQL